MKTLHKTILAGFFGTAASLTFAQNASADSVYQVKKGDTLYHIGAVNHVSVDQIKSANGLRNNLIYPGQKLKLSTNSTVTTTTKQTTNTTQASTNNNSAATYTVKAGDTLYKIASTNNVSVLDIQKLNNLKNVNFIYVGQKLTLKSGQTNTTTNQPQTTTNTNNTQQQNNNTTSNSTYTVVRGDTLYAISRKHNMSVGTLISLNKLSMSSIIFPGQKLIISSTSSNNSSTTTTNNSTTTTPSTSTNQAPITYIAAADTNHDNFMTMAEYNAYQEKNKGSVIVNVNTNNTQNQTNTGDTSGLNVNGLSSTQAAWLKSASANAQSATAGTGIRASITVAQAIIESGWGQSTLAQAPYNNLFGIKATSNWTGQVVNMSTGEYYNNQYHTVVAGFRAYSSQVDSFKDHTAFLLQNSRYAQNGVVYSASYQSMAQGLQSAGYATSPTYASTLISVVQRYGLASLDQ